MPKAILVIVLAALAGNSWAAPRDSDAFQAATRQIHEHLMHNSKQPDCAALAEPFAAIAGLAEAGHAPARIYHGINLMHDRICVDADDARGRALLEAVVAGNDEQYSPVAQAYLGADAYNRGDYAAALPLLQIGAAHDVAVANHYLGSMHATGRGVPKSEAQAARHWSAAATAGVAEAQYNIALMYIHGVGVNKDAVIAAIELALCKDQLPGLDAAERYRDVMAGLNPDQRNYVQMMATNIAAGLSAGKRAPRPEEVGLWRASASSCRAGMCL